MYYGSFVPECGKLLAIRHQLGAFVQIGAINAEDLVVGASNQIIAGVVVGFITLPDPDPLQPDQRGFVVLHRHAATFAIDAAAKSNFTAGVFGDNVIAVAAGIEIAGAVAIFEAEMERIIDGLVFRRVLGRHQQLHRADLLLRMLRQMAGVITTHEAGIGLLAERAAEHPGIEGGGFVDALLGVTGAGSDDGGNRGGDAGVFHGRLGLNAPHITLAAVGAGRVQTPNPRNERLLILALFCGWPAVRPSQKAPLSPVRVVPSPELLRFAASRLRSRSRFDRRDGSKSLKNPLHADQYLSGENVAARLQRERNGTVSLRGEGS